MGMRRAMLGLAVSFAVVGAGALAAAAIEAERVLYEQDFSSQLPTRWDTTLSRDADRWVGDGEYHLLVRSPWHQAVGLLLDHRFAGGCIAVDVTQRAGTPHCSYGLAFGFADPGNYYRFTITGDGYMEITRCSGGRWGYLVYRKRCYLLRLGCGATNRLEVGVSGCVLTFKINGAMMAEISDRCAVTGSIGVFVETLFSGEVHVAFDNVRVTACERSALP